MVLGNLGPALQLSALPMALSLAVTMALAPVLIRTETEIALALRFGLVSPGTLGIVMLIWLLSALWVAVRWHRFALAGEPPSLLPGPGREMMRYFLRMLAMVLIMALAGGVVGFVIGFLGAALRPPTGVAWAIVKILMFLATMVALRLSVSLPAMALGERVTLRQGWRALAHAPLTLAVLAGLSLAWNAGYAALTVRLSSLAIWPAIWLVVTWLTTLIGLSLLTTLYGHFVQGRPLARA